MKKFITTLAVFAASLVAAGSANATTTEFTHQFNNKPITNCKIISHFFEDNSTYWPLDAYQEQTEVECDASANVTRIDAGEKLRWFDSVNSQWVDENTSDWASTPICGSTGVPSCVGGTHYRTVGSTPYGAVSTGNPCCEDWDSYAQVTVYVSGTPTTYNAQSPTYGFAFKPQ